MKNSSSDYYRGVYYRGVKETKEKYNYKVGVAKEKVDSYYIKCMHEIEDEEFKKKTEEMFNTFRRILAEIIVG